MKILCPHCQKEIGISIKKTKEIENLSEKEGVDSKIIKIEETDNNITELVSKKNNIITPSAGDIDKNTFLNQLPSGDYWRQEFPKEIIVLHFTAGYNWQGAYSTFKRPGRVATPFIIDKEGPKYIVKLFDEKYWSYHLGIKGLECKNWINDKRSIGIEIVNIGPAWFKEGVWKDYVKKVWPENQVVKGRNRDADGNVKFPEEQVEAICDLINYLCKKWNIPKQVPKNKISCQLPQIGQFKGIVTHQMFREDKYDMGVAWPWEKVIERCGLKEIDL